MFGIFTTSNTPRSAWLTLHSGTGFLKCITINSRDNKKVLLGDCKRRTARGVANQTLGGRGEEGTLWSGPVQDEGVLPGLVLSGGGRGYHLVWSGPREEYPLSGPVWGRGYPWSGPLPWSGRGITQGVPLPGGQINNLKTLPSRTLRMREVIKPPT